MEFEPNKNGARRRDNGFDISLRLHSEEFYLGLLVGKTAGVDGMLAYMKVVGTWSLNLNKNGARRRDNGFDISLRLHSEEFYLGLLVGKRAGVDGILAYMMSLGIRCLSETMLLFFASLFWTFVAVTGF